MKKEQFKELTTIQKYIKSQLELYASYEQVNGQTVKKMTDTGLKNLNMVLEDYGIIAKRI